MLIMLGATLLHSQHTSDEVGCYIGREITKVCMVLVVMLLHGQRSSDAVGSYVGREITKMLIVLVVTLLQVLYWQGDCQIIHAVGYY